LEEAKHMFLIATSDGQILETESEDAAVALLDEYGPEVVSFETDTEPVEDEIDWSATC